MSHFIIFCNFDGCLLACSALLNFPTYDSYDQDGLPCVTSNPFSKISSDSEFDDSTSDSSSDENPSKEEASDSDSKENEAVKDDSEPDSQSIS